MGSNRRAELRRQEKAASSPAPIYNPNPMKIQVQREYDRVMKEVRENATEDAITMFLTITVKVMHDKYGWRSKKRLPDLAKALTDEFQRFYESGMDVERYCDEVDETTGLRFKTFDKGKQFGIDGYSNGEVIL